MRKKIIFNILTLIFSISTLFTNISYAAENTTESKIENKIEALSAHCILMEASTGKIIYEKDAHSKTSPASTTKIMTAILTLENCELSDTATVSHDAIFSVPNGYSHANLVEGETLTVEQLLNVLLIPSANDAANVLAEHVGGSIKSFCTMMNTKAIEIGCKNTHFVNSNGIQNDDHYTTAYDLALIGQYAMKNETFRSIVCKTKYSLPATDKYPETNRLFNTTNELLRVNNSTKSNNYYYKYAIGIKTGYTDKAKDCIVAGAKKDDMEYIVVILGGDKTENGLSQRYLDCKNLFEYAFNNYKLYTINERNSVVAETTISNGLLSSKKLSIVAEDDISLLIKKDTSVNDITPTIVLNSDLEAPISKNTVVGTISYSVDGNDYTCNLLAGNDINKSNFTTNILAFASFLLVVFFLYKLLNSNSKKKKSKKKKNSKKQKHEKNNYLYW